MMKKYIWISVILALVWACGGGDDSGDEPAPSRDFINIDPNAELLGDGQSTDITVTYNCAWTISKDVSKDDDWITVSPASGGSNTQGILTQRVNITAGKNTTGSPRTAVLTISGGTAPVRRCTVTQGKATESPVEPENPDDQQREPGAGDNLPPA